jgi:hypothetical protein
MPRDTLVIVLLLDAIVVVALTVIVLALRRWQRKVWLREQEQRAEGFPIEVLKDKEV